ncbi:MAG: integrase [Micavibrio sp.]|nr:integrase [Micavibrio sp.]
MSLTDFKCKNAKPKDKPYKLADGQGMYLDVRPNGSKYWRLKYRFHGKEKLLALGVYPEVSISEARDKKASARKQISEGIDPSLLKQKEKILSQQSQENTFKVIALELLDKKKGVLTEAHINTTTNRLEKDVFPFLGAYPVTEITPPILLQVIRKIEKRGAYDVAKRNLQVCSQVFRYAIQTGRAERDPAADLRGALTQYKKGHFAALDVKELPDLLTALNENKARLYPQTIYATQLLLLTFVRTSELIQAKWSEIDLEGKQWVIPAHRMKMRKEHIVPLSSQSVELFTKLKEMNGHRDWVFPNQVRPAKPMSNNTILSTFKRLGYAGRMTGHGCRALAMSAIKEKLGYRHEVIDRQLAHGHKNSINAAYDRAQFLDERTKMMQEWADYMEGLNDR